MLTGRVAAKGEGMLGQHLRRGPGNEPSTLCIFDEASGIDDTHYESSDTCAHGKLVICNCCSFVNFFYKGVTEGSLWDPLSKGKDGKPTRYYRKVIQIKGSDSPNVRAKKHILDGVLDYHEYVKRRTTWPKQRQVIGLDAEFFQDEN